MDSGVSCLMAIVVEDSVIELAPGNVDQEQCLQRAFDYIPLAALPCAADDASVCCGAGALATGLGAVAGESMLAESESMVVVVCSRRRKEC